MSELAKIFILCGVLFLAIGIAMLLIGKIPGIGKLPGDILIKKENYTFYFPVTTSILASIILSLFFYLWNHR